VFCRQPHLGGNFKKSPYPPFASSGQRSPGDVVHQWPEISTSSIQHDLPKRQSTPNLIRPRILPCSSLSSFSPLLRCCCCLDSTLYYRGKSRKVNTLYFRNSHKSILYNDFGFFRLFQKSKGTLRCPGHAPLFTSVHIYLKKVFHQLFIECSDLFKSSVHMQTHINSSRPFRPLRRAYC
jgi:hypothetical protein